MVLNPPTSQVVATVSGADAARLVGLKAVGNNQVTYGGVTAVGPGLLYPGTPGSDQYIFLRDFVYMAETYPGFFTHAYMRPVLDKFVTSIGGDPIGPNFPAEFIGSSGDFAYRPGAGDTSYYPTYDNSAFLVLLGALIYERGDTSVYSTYKAQFLQVLGAAPRSVSGCLYSDPLQYSTGWGFEDAQTSANKGDLGMGTAYYLLAYRKLASMATAEGDSATAATATAAGDALQAGLATLRRVDGYYNASSFDNKPHVMLSAMVVYFGFASGTDRLATATALLNDYNTYSVFAGDPGAKGGKIAHRGAIRHLPYPNYYADGSAVDTYQNGGAWYGHWVGWVAYALNTVSPPAATELMQSAVEGIMFLQRVTGNAPLEWFYGPGAGAASVPAALGTLAFMQDDGLAASFTIPGTNGSSAELRVEQSIAGRYTIQTSAASNVAVKLESAAETSTLIDPIPNPTPTYGAYSEVGYVSLAGQVFASTAELPVNAARFGGKLKATVINGDSGTITVKAERTHPTPSIEAAGTGPVVLDDYSTNLLSSAYTVTGSAFSVSGGKLQVAATANDADCAIWRQTGKVADGVFSIDANSADINAALPALIVRASADGQNGLVFMFGSTSLSVFERIDGAMNVIGIGTVALASNTDFNIKVKLVGSSMTVYVDDAQVAAGTVTIFDPGYFGPYVGVASPAAVSFDNLAYSVTEFTKVPAGFALLSPFSGWAPGDTPTETDSLTLRDPTGEVVATWASGSFRFEVNGLPFTSGDFALIGAEVVSSSEIAVSFTFPPDFPVQGLTLEVNGAAVPVVGIRQGSAPTRIIVTAGTRLTGGIGKITVTAAMTSSGQPVVPGSVSFSIRVPQEGVAPVAESAYSILRKFLSPAFGGPNWDTLLYSVATGDTSNKAAAADAFRQAFLETATSVYLSQRGAERGISRPFMLGDDRFRSLVRALDAERVTEHALWRILEVLYGPAATRAYASATVAVDVAPVTVGQSITLEFDDGVKVPVEFKYSDFATSTPTIAEFVATVNSALLLAGYRGYAEWLYTSDVSQYEVRIYSERLGFSGSVTVHGWLDGLSFNTAQTIPVGTLWDFTKLDDGHATVVIHTNLTAKETDELYVAGMSNAGVFEITAIATPPAASGDYPQYTYYNPTATTVSVTQTAPCYLYAVKRNTLQGRSGAAMVVSHDGQLSITVPHVPVIDGLEAAADSTWVLGDSVLPNGDAATQEALKVIDGAVAAGITGYSVKVT